MILIAACGTAAPPALTSTPALISGAVARLEAARTYHLVMTYTQDYAAFSLDLHVSLPGDAVGTVTVNGSTPLDVLQTGGRLFVHGQEFVSEYDGSRDGRLFGDRWVLATPDMIRVAVLDLPDLTAIPAVVLEADFLGTRVDHVPAATESTAQLRAAYGSLYITELPPHALVKFQGSPGFIPVHGFSNVSFEILGYDDPVDIQAPAQFADPTNPATLPPSYSMAGKWSWLACDQRSCGFKMTVVNNGGAYPDAPSTFRFDLTRTNGSLIDRCSGQIPVVPHGATTGISCRVAGQAWRSWAYGGGYFYGQPFLDNPAYDG